jgi:hypothetical protein
MGVRLSIERILEEGPNVKSALRFLSISPQVWIPGARVESALKVDACEHRAQQIGDSDILAAWLIAAIVLLLLFAFA